MTKFNIDMDKHPVTNPKALDLETDAYEQLHQTVHQWIWTGATGGLITGKYRVGKTWAIERLCGNIYTRGKHKIPAFYINMDDPDRKTVLEVYRRLWWSVGINVSRNARKDDLHPLFLHYLLDCVTKMDADKLVLLVDEVQDLNAKQVKVFASLHDDLQRLGITLTVIFIGNDPDCWDLIDQISEEHGKVYGRFFTQGTSYYGLRSEKEVKRCLKQFDRMRFPEDGPTLTECFVPDAFDNKWRIASLSNDVWRVYRQYRKQYKLKSWGMQYFAMAICTLLADFLPRYGVENFDDEMMHECIKISGLVPSLVRPAR